MELFTGGKPFIELTREELMKIKNQEAFIPIIYSEIVSMLKSRFGNEYTLKRLRDMGHKLADGLLKYWKPKNLKSIPEIITETYKFFLYRKLKVKRVLDKTYIYDEQCPVCYLDISDSDIPFCIVISGLIEQLINGLRQFNPRLPEVRCETTHSRSMGANICIHVIETI